MGGICSKSKTRNQAPEYNKKSKPLSKPSAVESETAAMPEAVTLIQPEIRSELYTPEAERYTEQSGIERSCFL